MKATVDLPLFGKLLDWMADCEQEEIRVAGIDGVFASYFEFEIPDEDRALPVRLVTTLGAASAEESTVFILRNPASKIVRGLDKVIRAFSDKKLKVTLPEDDSWYSCEAFLNAMGDKAVVAETTEVDGEDKLDFSVIFPDGKPVRLIRISGTLDDPPEDSPLVFTLPHRDEDEPSILFDGERFAGRESEVVPNTTLVADMQDLGLKPEDRASFIRISNKLTKKEIEPEGKFTVKKSTKSSIPVEETVGEEGQAGAEAQDVTVPEPPGISDAAKEAAANEAEKEDAAEKEPEESLVQAPPASSDDQAAEDEKEDESAGETETDETEESESEDGSNAEETSEEAGDESAEEDDSDDDSDDDDSDDTGGKETKRKRRSTQEINDQAVKRLRKYGYEVTPPPSDEDNIDLDTVSGELLAVESKLARARAMLEQIQDSRPEQSSEIDPELLLSTIKSLGIRIKE